MPRTVCYVHLDVLRDNLKKVLSRVKPGVDVIASVKANCNGMGMVQMYPIFKEEGVSHFAIATADEGVELRNCAGDDVFIMTLGDVCDEDLEKLFDYNITPTVHRLDMAQKINAIALKRGVVKDIDIKLDTGMNRIGFQVIDINDPESYGPLTEKSFNEILEISKMEGLKIVGCHTHFARADELNSDPSIVQYNRFMAMVTLLEANGVEIPRKHVANSATTLQRPTYQLDAVRPGGAILGLNPVEDEVWPSYEMHDVVTWETYVANVKTLPKDSPISYGGTYVTDHETRVATIPVGFADGYFRHLSNKGAVVIHGELAPIVGRVCMDQFMVDVTNIPDVKYGDKVMLLDGDKMSVMEMAARCGTNADSIVLNISYRVPKVWVGYEKPEQN